MFPNVNNKSGGTDFSQFTEEATAKKLEQAKKQFEAEMKVADAMFMVQIGQMK